MKTRSGILFLAAVFCLSFSSFAEETITITTYYPSPYGVYKVLQVHPGPQPTEPGEEGQIYYDAAAHVLKFYNGTGWQEFGVTGGDIPRGAIVMWSGTAANIPAGWVLCDGTSGSPDLRERFIVGAGGNNPSVTGGAYPIGPGGDNNNSITLNLNQIPSHTHSGSTASAGSHSHSYRTQYGSTTASGSNNQAATPLYNNQNTGSAGAHTHTLSINSTGGGQSHENRPPYYALCFIMKL